MTTLYVLIKDIAIQNIRIFNLYAQELTTYILLQRSTPNGNKGSYETFGINTHISDSTNTNTQKHNSYAQLCISGVPNLVHHNFQKTGYRNHTELCNLSLNQRICDFQIISKTQIVKSSKYYTLYLIKSHRVPHQTNIHSNDREVCKQNKFQKLWQGQMRRLNVS